jgi:hypothetical protein
VLMRSVGVINHPLVCFYLIAIREIWLLPLPRSVPKDLFETSLSQFAVADVSSTIERTFMIDPTNKWYVLDENSIPPEYVLTSLTQENESEY